MEKKTKVCTKCGIEKELIEFYKDSRQKDSLNLRCKQCVKNYRLENLDIIKAREEEYRKNNRGAIKKRSHDYYEKNKECISLNSKKYREENKEKVQKREKQSYVRNFDKVALRKKIYQQKNKEKIKEYNQKYRENNSDRIALQKREKYNRFKEEIRENRKKYREENKEKIKIIVSKYGYSAAKYNGYETKLTIEEDPIEGENGELLCRCTHCREYFSPTVYQIRNRVQSLNGKNKSENRLYCSDKCKTECTIYLAKNVPRDQRDRFQQARCNQPVNRQALLDLQIDEFGYNFCDKCGTEKQQSELIIHHNLMVSKYISEADNMAHQLITCEDCHDHKGC